MDVTGEPDGEPQKVGVAVCDLFTGLYGVIAIEAALIERERTGRGQQIDLALFDTMGAMLANQAMNYLASGVPPRRMGNVHPNIAPYQTFPVADGFVIIAVGNDAQFARLCAALGLEALAEDARFSTNAARVANRAELTRELTAKTRLKAPRRIARRARKGRRPGRADQHGRRPLRRPAVRCAPHANRSRGNPRRSQPDRDERIPAFARPAFAEAQRARGEHPARDRARISEPPP